MSDMIGADLAAVFRAEIDGVTGFATRAQADVTTHRDRISKQGSKLARWGGRRSRAERP